MSNLESDCSHCYLPLRLDSLPNITSYFVPCTYPVCRAPQVSQITVLGAMLTWHPSTEILSRLTACIYSYAICFWMLGRWRAAGDQAKFKLLLWASKPLNVIFISCFAQKTRHHEESAAPPFLPEPPENVSNRRHK